MKLARCACVTGLLIIAAALFALQAKAAEPCALKELADLDATLTTGREVIVPAMVNGHELRFMLDTGSVASMLMSHVARDLNLPIKELPGSLYGLGGQITTHKTNVHDFKIGGNVGHDFEMILTEDLKGYADIYDGILGNMFLSQFDVEIDLASQKIRFFSQDHCDGNVIYWQDSGLMTQFHLNEGKQIILQPFLNNIPTDATLDTGASMTYLSWIAANKIGIEKDSPGVTPGSDVVGMDGKKLASFRYKLESIEIGGEKLSKYLVAISASKKYFRDSEVLIGVEFFTLNRVYIAFREHRLYFTPYTGDQVKSIYSKIKP